MVLIPIKRKTEIYSDFSKELTQNPVSLDMARITNEASVKESIKNLLMTDRGERLFKPNVGCDIRKLLFDNITPNTFSLAKELIKDTLETYEPRCEIIDIDVLSEFDNEIKITLLFTVINIETPITYSITLSRVR